ncbi:hypothetical protein [Niastella sp. OAS944]|uniref:hypothetical protein n=1 Tax=Niastella sp. OAS944 TaxID=2664089 RepID=UPI00349A3EF2|nr:hypothetical protein [Chitinophagaceae bacterium OAS944]
MGLDYSIKTYIKKDKLPASLKWLSENSVKGEKTLQIRCNNEISHVTGLYFKIKNHPPLTADTIIEDFTVLDFFTSLIVDIDPKVLASVANDANFYSEPFLWLEDYKEDFEERYLGKGKISVGGFDTTIKKIENSDVYEMSFMAVTSKMSLMIAKSIAVKKWIVDFSKASDAIFSYVDMEDLGRNVYYYKGPVNLTLNTNYDTHRYPAFATFFNDYRMLLTSSGRPSENTGLSVSIVSYFKQEMLPACLQWLQNNTWAQEKLPFPVPRSGETVHFSTSLIFDLDSTIIVCVQDLQFDMDMVKDFKNNFESIYLQNGKVKIGPFEVRLTKIRDSDLYEIAFRPKFHWRDTWVIKTSFTVKKWILELSIAADSILSFIDQEVTGHRILYYKGYQLDFKIHDLEEIISSASINDFFSDCYALDPRENDI